MIDADVRLSLNILHRNGTKKLITEGIPMTDDGYGGMIFKLYSMKIISIIILSRY